MLSYGVRSKCCYAPIRLGNRKTKTGRLVQIWICCKCKTKDVDLVDYTGPEGSETTSKKNKEHHFALPEDQFQD